MNRAFIGKVLLVVGLSFSILIPLEMIRGVINERVQRRQEAISSIAASSAGEQILAGPVLIAPYVDVENITDTDAQGKQTTRTNRTEGVTYLFPKELQMDGKLEPQTRYRGLHRVRVYEWQGKLNATFSDILPQAAGRTYGAAMLSVQIKDVRGIVGSPRLTLNQQVLDVKNGSAYAALGGIHARVPALVAGERFSGQVSLQLNLSGTESLSLVPLGDSNKFTMSSSWKHPQFAGDFLPRTRTVNDQGFQASWEISALAANTQRQFLRASVISKPGVADGSNAQLMMDALSVNLVEPVNVYTQTDRASKYGLLFVLLTFVGFFMFELIKQLAIHPIQYLLVGLSLTIFFLLLLSLSEHIPFVYAYLIASVACIGLLVFYLSHVLQSKARGFGFGAMLTALYGALYGLLASEDNSLAMGSLLLFAILAVIMVVTRKIDWYQITNGNSNTSAKTRPDLSELKA